MSTNLTCSQVSALLSFYANDSLSESLKKLVKEHLEICPQCREKYETLKNFIADLKKSKAKIDQVGELPPTSASVAYQEYQNNLSAYIDNELSDYENLKIKKYAIANAKARKEMENMYALKRALQGTFDRTKNEFREDFSKFIMSKNDLHDEMYKADPLLKGLTFAFLLATVVALGILSMIF